MAGTRHREEVLNVELARLLNQQGVVAAPEQIVGATDGRTRRLPDVTIVDHQGLRVTIEGKYAAPRAGATVLEQAEKRVEDGIAQIALSILYPQELRTVPYEALPAAMSDATYKVVIVTEAASSDWVEGGLGDIASLIRRGFADLLREDVVAAATAVIEEGVERFATTLLGSRGAATRVMNVLNGTANPAMTQRPVRRPRGSTR